MLRLLRSGAGFREILISLLVMIPIVLFSLSFHEAAHALISYRQGDPTARSLGRLTLDPLKHIDPIGAVFMLLFGIGWAKPVPVNARYYKNPKWGMVLTAAAGPTANLILAFASMLVYVVLVFSGVFTPIMRGVSGFSGSLLYILYLLLTEMAYMNVFLAVFNLIPVPPFDGSRIAFALMPSKWYFAVMKYERIIMIVMLILLYTGIMSGPLSAVASWLFNALQTGAYYVVSGVVSLWRAIFG